MGCRHASGCQANKKLIQGSRKEIDLWILMKESLTDRMRIMVFG